MKKKYLTLGKKTLSLVMACLMVMTCWVFVAPTKAEATAKDIFDAYPLSNVNTTVSTVLPVQGTSGFENDGEYLSTDNYKEVYNNLLYVGMAYESSPVVSQTGLDMKNSDAVSSIKWWYPSVVWLYDGTNTPSMGIAMYFATRGNSYNVRAYSSHLATAATGTSNSETNYYTANYNGLSIGNSQWRGEDSRLNFQWNYCAHASSLMFYSACDWSGYITRNGNDDEKYYTNLLKFTGSMSNTEYSRTITPYIGFMGQQKSGDSSRYYSFLSNTPIYVINYVPLRTAIEEVASYYNTYKANLDNYSNYYTEESATAFINAIKGLMNAKPNNYSYSSGAASAVSSYASTAAAAITAWNNAKNALVRQTYTVTWKDGNGATLNTNTVAVGDTPSYSGSTPTKAEDDNYVYAFNNSWSPAISPVTGNVTYTAQFDGTAKYTITFAYATDANGTKKEDVSIVYLDGTSADTVLADAPTNTAADYDDTNHYTYSWPTIGTVVGDATYTETRSVHKHVFNYTDITDTNHTENCTDCSRVIIAAHEKLNGKSTGHTCTTDGYITYQCGKCGKTYQLNGYKLVNGEEVADPAAHDYATILTDKGDGTHGYKCTVCGDYDKIAAHVWTLGTGDSDILVAPTCMAEGSGNYYCSCGATKVGTIAKLPYDDAASHVIGNVTSNEDGTHSGKCTVEGCNYQSSAVACTDTDGDGDCKCDYCTYVFPCVYDKKVATDAYLATPADCLNAAVYYYSCDCGASSKDTNSEATFSSGEPLGHDYSEMLADEAHLKDAATCTTAANYWYDCSRCESISADKFYASGDPLGHEASDVLVTNGATQHGYQCVRYAACGELVNVADCTFTTYTDNGDGTHTASCAVGCGNTKTGDHVMSDWTSDNENGTVAGTQSRHCTVCTYAENTQGCKYEQKGHVDPTCKTTGYTIYKCSDCGHGYSVVHAIDPTNHSNYGTENVTVTAATCTAKGEYKKVCKECEADIETGLELPIDPENHGDHTTTTTGDVTATCVIEGHSGTVTCNGCNAVITADVNLGLDPDNHVYRTPYAKLDPTCTVDGHTEYETCNDCDAVLGKEIINKLGHEYTGKAVDNNDGTHSYKCARYDACQTVGTTADGENGKVACSDAEPAYTDPKCNVDGYWTHTCDTCGYVWIVTDTGSALIHDYSINDEGNNVIAFDDEDKHAYYCQHGCGTYGVGTGNDATDLKEDCSGGSATCTDKAVCSVCNKEYGEALGHDYTGAAVDNTNGTHSYKCVRYDACGTIGTTDGGVNGTVACYDASPVVTAPTCLADGYTTHVCDTCGYTWTTDTVSALGHNYTEQKIDADHLKDVATCETKATYWYDCSRCTANAKDAEDAETNTALYFEYGQANGHTFDRKEVAEDYLKTPATCTENAVYYVSCSVCYKSSALVEGETKTFAHNGSKLGHLWVKVADDAYLKEKATCESAAVYYTSCERCYVSSKSVSAETATFSYGTANDHVFTEELPNTAHRLSAATCTASAVYYYDCINCTVNAKNLSEEEVAKYTADGKSITYQYGDLAPNNHTDLVTVPYKAPTCGVEGNNEHKYCNDCQTSIGKTVYAALEHNFTGAYVYDAEADTHKRACVNKCGAYGDEVACSFGSWTQSTVDGKQVHTRVCVCGNSETADCSGGTATCTQKATCDTCGKTYGDVSGHNYSDTWVKVDGKDVHKRVCANNCGIDITEACSGGTATCSALAVCDTCKAAYGKYTDHSFGTYEKSAEASCGVNAKETAKCLYCDATDTREIAGTALQHVMSDYVYTTAPTCKDEGEERSTCTLGCGYYITRPVPADKNAHVWSEWTEIGGDCASGIIEERECSVCGVKEKRTNTDNLEHSWVTKVEVKPGCETDGYINQYCSKCGFIQETTTPATGHNYEGEFTFYSAATCTSAEIWARPCANHCGKYEFKEIEGSMLEHRWVIMAGSAANCTSDGYTDIYHCVDCQFEKGGDVVPAIPHADTNGDGQCDSCNGQMSQDGSSACSCICHKNNAFMRFIFKIVNFFWKLFKIGKTCDCGAVHW